MTRHRWAALAVMASLMLAACGGGSKSADGQIDGSTASSAPAASMEDLADALDISVPDGYVLQPPAVGDTGPSDIEKAVRDDGGDDAREVLTRTRFVRGYQRMWSRSDADEIVSYVYQFADHAGAVEYTNRMTAVISAPTEGVTISRFDVPGINGAAGVNGTVDKFSSSSVSFAKGPYSVQMVVSGSSPTGLETMASAMAEEQYSRL
jgi:hypothetical protein